MSLSDSASFARAEREYLEPPDDDSEECEECDSGKIETECDYCDRLGKHPLFNNEGFPSGEIECEECEGTGNYKIDCSECDGTGAIDREKARQDFLDAKADHDYQAYKDRKAEEG